MVLVRHLELLDVASEVAERARLIRLRRGSDAEGRLGEATPARSLVAHLLLLVDGGAVAPVARGGRLLEGRVEASGGAAFLPLEVVTAAELAP